MALAACGIKKTQGQLAKALGTKNDNIGTKNSAMVAVAKQYGLLETSKEKKSIKELTKYLATGKIIIVSHFYEPDQTGHFAVVKKITKKAIILLDPEAGPSKTYSFANFKKIWHDNEGTRGWFLVIKR